MTPNQLRQCFTKKHQGTHRPHNTNCATAVCLVASRGFSHAVTDRFWRRFCPLTPSQEQTKSLRLTFACLCLLLSHTNSSHAVSWHMTSCKTGYFKYANSGKIGLGKKHPNTHTHSHTSKESKNNNPSVSQRVGEKSQCSLSEHVQGQRWVWNGENGWKKVRENRKKECCSLLMKRPSVKKKTTAGGCLWVHFFRHCLINISAHTDCPEGKHLDVFLMRPDHWQSWMLPVVP